MTAVVRDEGGDAAQLMAAFICTLDPQDLVDLRDGLGIICRHTTGSRLREANLGLLVQLIEGPRRSRPPSTTTSSAANASSRARTGPTAARSSAHGGTGCAPCAPR